MILAPQATAQIQSQATEPPPFEEPAGIPRDNWDVRFETQDLDGSLYTWTGHPAQFEDSRMLFRAEFISYDRDTGDVVARGNVYFRSFERSEQLWCDHLEYNTETEKGRFYDVRGETVPRILTRPGTLSTNSPFHFEGRWAERIGEKYILHDGWITNCKLPKPWWRVIGPRFDIVPGSRAIAYRSQFRVRKVPIFYTPIYYHSLEKEPRKSGFLTPSPGHSSIGGFMLGLGYFWAINRSNDVTYRVTDYFSRGYAHHVDLRGKPRPGTDYDVILYGVQDRGDPNHGKPPENQYGGMSVYAVGSSDLGKGWTARAQVNYVTSFRFRQGWTQSFNEAIGSEIHSVGFVNKNWSTFTLDAAFARLQNFQDLERPIIDHKTGDISYTTDAVTIRKLPEVELSSRDHRVFRNIPLWFSFDSSAGLLTRSESFFASDPAGGYVVTDRFQTGPQMNRINLAPHLTSALHFWSFNLVPSFGFQETLYSEGQTPFEDHYHVVGTDIVRSARDFSLDLIFPPLVRVFNKKTVFGDKLKHVIEPRATYRYVTGVGTDFNRFILFDATDLLANTSQLELSLTNRIYAKRGDKISEIFTWELMQARFFDPTFGGAVLPGQRNIFDATAFLSGFAFVSEPRAVSPVISRLRISPINGLGIGWQADYDSYRGGIVNSTFALDYSWHKFRTSISDDAIHTNPALAPAANQYIVRLSYGDANRKGWSAGATSVYDYRQARVLYTTMQFAHNTDCCGIAVQFHRYNVGIRDEKYQFRVSFVVANIGSFGTLRKQDRLF